MADLGEEVGVYSLLAPDASNGNAIVDNKELRIGSEPKVGRRCYEAVPP